MLVRCARRPRRKRTPCGVLVVHPSRRAGALRRILSRGGIDVHSGVPTFSAAVAPDPGLGRSVVGPAREGQQTFQASCRHFRSSRILSQAYFVGRRRRGVTKALRDAARKGRSSG